VRTGRGTRHASLKEASTLRKTLLSAMVAVLLATTAPAFAQGRGDDRGSHREDRQEQRHDQGRRAWQEHEARGREHHDRRDERGEGRGAGPGQRLHRGDRLPFEYRNRHYVVDDWRGPRLSAPPRGYHWVQVGGDYVLVAIGTGVILQLLLSN
jgi:Ni/Co efflux regulator RcnB